MGNYQTNSSEKQTPYYLYCSLTILPHASLKIKTLIFDESCDRKQTKTHQVQINQIFIYAYSLFTEKFPWMSSICLVIFLRWALWADSVSALCYQFKPIRIEENLELNYNKLYNRHSDVLSQQFTLLLLSSVSSQQLITTITLTETTA